jgi:hypothetical protein
MHEPKFLDSDCQCHRVKECERCDLKMNRDLAAASNITWAAKHRLVHGYHPWRPRSEKDLVARVEEILKEEYVDVAITMIFPVGLNHLQKIVDFLEICADLFVTQAGGRSRSGGGRGGRGLLANKCERRAFRESTNLW